MFAEFTETDFRDGFSLAISFAKTVQGDFGVDDSAVRRYRLTSERDAKARTVAGTPLFAVADHLCVSNVHSAYI